LTAVEGLAAVEGLLDEGLVDLTVVVLPDLTAVEGLIDLV
jgi:phage tail protein X